MTIRALRYALALLFLLGPGATAVAQREGYSYLSYVGSEVSLFSRAEDDSSARPNTPVLAGDRIATGSSSRAEVILADGNVLRIDVLTNLRFDRLAKTYETEDERNAIYLERGAVSVDHRWSTSREEATRIDTDDVTVLLPDKGLYRVETGRRGTEIFVTSGRAEVHARSGRASLRSGQYVFVSGDSPLEPDWLPEPSDRFAGFVAERRDLVPGDAASAYVSDDYAYDYAASDLDSHGSWILVGGSWAWRPSVASDWRPYVDGYWRWSPAGLTWVSYEPWGWLPYHYGSWYWDVGFGWYWAPGAYYSPAWVYWSYTPSWVGWCPIGYYGGYYGGPYGGGGHHDGGNHDPYATSHRNRVGAERGTHAYPHLRGKVEVTRVDPRGWSYASVDKMGTRLEARRDVLGHERVGFKPGERGVVATTPLRIERGRGGSATTAIQEAVRRAPRSLGDTTRGGGGGGVADLTPVLRRERTLGTTTRDGLRRSWVTAGQDPAYRPVPADQLAAPRRDAAPGSSIAGAPSRGRDRAPGAATAPGRTTDGSSSRRIVVPPTQEPWRDAGVPAETRAGRGPEAAPSRSVEPPLTGGFGRDRSVRGDDGWRSPGTETRSGAAPSRTFDVPARRPSDTPSGSETPARSERRDRAPDPEASRSTTGSTTRREAPAPPRDEGWRGSSTPPRSSRSGDTAPAPRYEAPSRPPEPPPSRSYDIPRSAPAPRYEAPSRRSDAPPSHSYNSQRSAPAPRYAPPSRSSSSSSSRSYQAPARSSAPPPSRSQSSAHSAPPSSSRSSSPPPARSSGGSSGSSRSPH